MKTSIHVRYLYYSLYHAYTSIYIFMVKYAFMHVDFFYHTPTIFVGKVLHEGERDGDLTYRSKE